jgi:hypothetical protein
MLASILAGLFFPKRKWVWCHKVVGRSDTIFQNQRYNDSMTDRSLVKMHTTTTKCVASSRTTIVSPMTKRKLSWRWIATCTIKRLAQWTYASFFCFSLSIEHAVTVFKPRGYRSAWSCALLIPFRKKAAWTFLCGHKTKRNETLDMAPAFPL